MIKREFLLSLGITVLVSGLLFLYFRNRFKHIEHKVNTMFQLVQNHVQQPTFNVPTFREKENLIDVSEDDESDSEESDTDDETDDETEKGEVDSLSNTLPTKISFTQLPGTLDIEMISHELEGVGSLSDSEDEGVELVEVVVDSKEDSNEDSKEDSKEDSNEDSKEDSNEDSNEEDEGDEVDYSKLTVVQLKEEAEKKGYSNFKKLRKQGLVQLLNN